MSAPSGDQVPAGLARVTAQLFGEEGIRWVQLLPALLGELQARWSLRLEPPLPSATYSCVLPARRADGTPAVLKLSYPRAELSREAQALRAYAGRGAVKLLEADVERGALLLERAEPGEPLSGLPDDEQATRIAARLAARLWRPLAPGHPFRPVEAWAAGLDRLRARFQGGTGPLPAELVERAEGLFRWLLASSGPPVLLHGDLHHFNILSARREPWLAVDPKGVAGEPAYEVGALLRNPMPELARRPHLKRILARRVELLSQQLALPRERITGWGAAQAVLSLWWTLEDHGQGWGEMLPAARTLLRLHEEG